MDFKDEKTHIPWIVFEAKDWLDGYLKSDMRVFEWGSGGSTLYFSKRVGEVVSVEHDEKWHAIVKDTLDAENISNCQYYLVKPKKSVIAKYLPYDCKTYVSRTFAEHKDLSFRNYVKKIDTYPDAYFDFISIDGRARSSCIKSVLRKIRKGGVLMLDNSERNSYKAAMKLLNKYEKVEFFGHGPYADSLWQTTFWKI